MGESPPNLQNFCHLAGQKRYIVVHFISVQCIMLCENCHRQKFSHSCNVHRTLLLFGLTLNSEKCLFNQKSLTYFGLVFSAQGLSPDPHKVKAIQEAPPPTSVKAVRSFLGMASYCSKFIHNFSHLADPLRELTKKDVPFKWTGKHGHAFKQLKAALTSSTVMSYFDPKKETEVVTDASPYRLSAILTQTTPGQDDRKVIAYVSRSLTPVERRYSQTEREALAIVWAVARLHTYLYGSSFTLYTDCKPIELILNNPRSKTSARIERWNLRLQDYWVV